MSFTTLITGNAGIISRWLAGVIVACIVVLLSHFGFNLDPDLTLKLAGAVALGIPGLLGEIASKINSNGTSAIQKAFAEVASNVQQDGHAGENTVATAQQIVATVKELQATKQP